MTYTEEIKSGFRLINKKWQLVAIQASIMIANLIGFLIIVGIPLGIAFIIFGLDMTGLAETKNILGLFKNPAELVSKYMGLVLLVLASFLFYVLMITTLGLFIFGGSIGFIGRILLEPSLKFSFRVFFSEAKKIFFPLMWFSVFMGLVFIIIAFVLGLFGGGIAAIVSSAKSQDSTLALFLGIFFSLLLALAALMIIFVILAITVYGFAVLFFKKEGAFKSFRGALKFLWKRQNAFWLYVMLFIAYILASFTLMLLTYPFSLIPIVGTIITFPLHLFSSVIQSYLGLVIIATVFHYYYDTEIKAETPSGTFGTCKISTSNASDNHQCDIQPQADTSGSQASVQEVTPPGKEPKGEA